MMALVDDKLTVTAYQIGDFTFSNQALNESDIDPAGRLALTAANGANVFGIKRQKFLQPLDPLP